VRGARARDGFCATHLSTFGSTCTRCESEAARREVVREQILAGKVSIEESADLVPEWAPSAQWFRMPEQDADDDADDDADCL
jgi:hypothetical protein